MMTPEQFDQWVSALRSGEYAQGRQQLRSRRSNGEPAYCCLGLFCHLNGVDLSAERHVFDTWAEASGEENMAPRVLIDAIETEMRSRLAMKNDSGATFEEIADYLEANRANFVA